MLGHLSEDCRVKEREKYNQNVKAKMKEFLQRILQIKTKGATCASCGIRSNLAYCFDCEYHFSFSIFPFSSFKCVCCLLFVLFFFFCWLFLWFWSESPLQHCLLWRKRAFGRSSSFKSHTRSPFFLQTQQNRDFLFVLFLSETSRMPS